MSWEAYKSTLKPEVLQKLTEEEISSVEQLASLSSAEWRFLGLKLGDISRLRLMSPLLNDVVTPKRPRPAAISDSDGSENDEPTGQRPKNGVTAGLLLEGIIDDDSNVARLIPSAWRCAGPAGLKSLLCPSGRNLNPHSKQELEFLALLMGVTSANDLAKVELVVWARAMVVLLKAMFPASALDVPNIWNAEFSRLTDFGDIELIKLFLKVKMQLAKKPSTINRPPSNFQNMPPPLLRTGQPYHSFRYRKPTEQFTRRKL